MEDKVQQLTRLNLSLQEKMMEKGSTKNAVSVILPGQSGLSMQEVMIRTVPNAMQPTLDGVSINFSVQFIFPKPYYSTDNCMMKMKFYFNQRKEIIIIYFYVQFTNNKSISCIQLNTRQTDIDY